jgi:hypothetical protein
MVCVGYLPTMVMMTKKGKMRGLQLKRDTRFPKLGGGRSAFELVFQSPSKLHNLKNE